MTTEDAPYLTLVYRTSPEARARLTRGDFSAASWSHALHERDAALAALTLVQQERDELRAALGELVALKDLRDEELRCRQRREVSIQRKPEEVARVNAMRDDYNGRKPAAWANARAVLTPKATRPTSEASRGR